MSIIGNALSSAQAMMEEGDDIYAAMAMNVEELAMEQMPVTLKEYRDGIETIILARNWMNRRPRNHSRRTIARSIKFANALSAVSNYFHDKFFNIAQAGLASHDEIVSNLSRALPSPEIRAQNHALTNAKGSPILSFEQMHYVDTRFTDTGLRVWAVVVREKGKKPAVHMLPSPDNLYFADIYERIDERCENQAMYLVLPSVKNYIKPLFDE